MDHLPTSLLFVLVVSVFAVSQASLAPQIYWHTKLPNTKMPSSIIQQLLKTDVAYEEESSTDVNVGKGGVHVNAGQGKPGATRVDVSHGGGVGVNVGKGGVGVNVGKGGGVGVDVGHGGGVGVNVGKGGGVGVNVGRGGGVGVDVGHGGGVGVNVGHGGGVGVDVGHGGVGVDVGHGGGVGVDVGHGGGVGVNVGHGTGVGVQTGYHHKGKPVYVYVGKGSPFNYNYAAKATQLHDDSSTAFFFLEKDVRAGTKLNLRFYNPMPASTFLPRDVADSIPFSTSKTTEILSKLSIEPTSAEATAINNTLNTCEKPAAKGEDRFCATSLESMVDYAISKLGKDPKVVSTEAAEDSKLRTCTVAPEGVQELNGSKSVTCHREAYAYAVYYCHETYETSAYTVPLVRDDGSKVEAVAVCHKDTSAWNPKHLAFQVLNVKPGSVPVCHFLPQDHLVWVSAN